MVAFFGGGFGHGDILGIFDPVFSLKNRTSQQHSFLANS